MVVQSADGTDAPLRSLPPATGTGTIPGLTLHSNFFRGCSGGASHEVEAAVVQE